MDFDVAEATLQISPPFMRAGSVAKDILLDPDELPWGHSREAGLGLVHVELAVEVAACEESTLDVAGGQIPAVFEKKAIGSELANPLLDKVGASVERCSFPRSGSVWPAMTSLDLHRHGASVSPSLRLAQFLSLYAHLQRRIRSLGTCLLTASLASRSIGSKAS